MTLPQAHRLRVATERQLRRACRLARKPPAATKALVRAANAAGVRLGKGAGL